MKTLYLLRHAKSSWDNADLSDFERPLNERGMRAAPFMGKLMRERGLLPDLILSSPAERAKQTTLLVKEAGKLPAEIRFEESIYEASPLRLLRLISELDNDLDSVMLIGHNPGFEGLVHFLSGRSEAMPTAALAVIEMETDNWSKANLDCCSLRFVIRPKEEMEKARNESES